MISNDDFVEALREARGDKELTFVNLESRFRRTLHDRLESIDDGRNMPAYNAYYIDYMNHTLAAAQALDIQDFDSYSTPSHSVEYSLFEAYKDFVARVDHFTIRVRIASAQHSLLYSVHLSPEAKRKIHHYGEQIRKIVEGAELDLEKKEELLAYLNKFLAEVDRDRTRMEVIGSLLTGYAYILGETAKALDPIRGWLELIAKLFGKAQEEEPKSLPRSETRQLPAPPKRLPRSENKKREDDDIPF